MSAALVVGPAQFLVFAPYEKPPLVDPEKAGLLRLWTPKEYFRAMARDGVPQGRALDDAPLCRRCNGVHRARLRAIARTEYDRLFAEAKGGR